jgi:mono/diheme cytochrome c family protein
VVLNQHGKRRISLLGRRESCLLTAGLCLSLFAATRPGQARPAPTPEENAKQLSFNDTIQPILSENCYACHGPDPGGRKAGLRLDRGEFAFAPHQDAHEKYGPAIIPGNPDKSPLVHRIETKNVKDRMPPPEAHKTLKPEQIALLREWVKQGAKYEELWSFLPPRHQPIPAVAHREWVRNAIDNFVLARLEKEGLATSPQADRRSLIRRVTYDLTGLPPTPEEVEAFVADAAPDAYDKVVDRLLASPRYGEHRAHYWLDVARYGDTHGLHLDNFRNIWAYRDYVIRAYNQNKPFDQFVREQLAGDMLPLKTLDGITASAYLRAGISSGEGGTLIEELRVNNKRERTEAYGAAFLGLTVGCANCHDHKFDPITQKDFYRLTAFFNNLTEFPSNDDRNDWPPFLRLPKIENREAYEQVLAKRSELERQISLRRERERELIAAWIGQTDRSAIAAPVNPDRLTVRLRFDEQNGSTFIDTAPNAPQKHVSASGAPVIWGEGTLFWPYMRMDISSKLELPNSGEVEANQPFSVGTWLRPQLRPLEYKDEEKPAGVILSAADAGQKLRGWQMKVSKGKLTFALAHEMPDNSIQVETKDRVLSVGRWNHVLATYDGSGKAAGVALFIDGRPQALTIIKDTLQGSTRTNAPLEFARAYPDSDPLRQSAFQDFRFFQRSLSADEAARLPVEDYVSELVQKPMAGWSEDEFHAVSQFYFSQRDDVTQKLKDQIAPLNEELDRLSKEGPITLVSEEGPGLPYADVLTRGAFAARTERVRPGVPHFLPPLPANAPLDRRGLAEWTVSLENPLTARVSVNRMWSEIFGTGLVETTEDFGVMGGRPSHPELLDWLALDFREYGWDVKRFYKQLVMSATYQQSARVTPQLLEIDPKNRLLARGPRFRMDGEMLRDTALAASGLLVEKIGGPSVKPYQPPGVWEAGSHQGSDTKSYTQDHGDALYRRSLYTFWKRMATMPDMDTLDVPVHDSACTRRQRTDTPLQALVLMNDPQWLEASRKLAERVIRQSNQTDTRLNYLGEVLLARDWAPREKQALENALTKFQSTYGKEQSKAEEILKVGDSNRDTGIRPDELASWMLVASAAMNLDVVVNK